MSFQIGSEWDSWMRRNQLCHRCDSGDDILLGYEPFDKSFDGGANEQDEDGH